MVGIPAIKMVMNGGMVDDIAIPTLHWFASIAEYRRNAALVCKTKVVACVFCTHPTVTIRNMDDLITKHQFVTALKYFRAGQRDSWCLESYSCWRSHGGIFECGKSVSHHWPSYINVILQNGHSRALRGKKAFQHRIKYSYHLWGSPAIFQPQKPWRVSCFRSSFKPASSAWSKDPRSDRSTTILIYLHVQRHLRRLVTHSSGSAPWLPFDSFQCQQYSYDSYYSYYSYYRLSASTEDQRKFLLRSLRRLWRIGPVPLHTNCTALFRRPWLRHGEQPLSHYKDDRSMARTLVISRASSSVTQHLIRNVFENPLELWDSYGVRNLGIFHGIPSGNYGKSPCCMGKSIGHFP